MPPTASASPTTLVAGCKCRARPFQPATDVACHTRPRLQASSPAPAPSQPRAENGRASASSGSSSRLAMARHCGGLSLVFSGMRSQSFIAQGNCLLPAGAATMLVPLHAKPRDDDDGRRWGQDGPGRSAGFCSGRERAGVVGFLDIDDGKWALRRDEASGQWLFGDIEAVEMVCAPLV